MQLIADIHVHVDSLADVWHFVRVVNLRQDYLLIKSKKMDRYVALKHCNWGWQAPNKHYMCNKDSLQQMVNCELLHSNYT